MMDDGAKKAYAENMKFLCALRGIRGDRLFCALCGGKAKSLMSLPDYFFGPHALDVCGKCGCVVFAHEDLFERLDGSDNPSFPIPSMRRKKRKSLIDRAIRPNRVRGES